MIESVHCAGVKTSEGKSKRNETNGRQRAKVFEFKWFW